MAKKSQRRFTAEEKLQVLQESEYGNMSINALSHQSLILLRVI